MFGIRNKYNYAPDGTVRNCLQKGHPGADKDDNWLPAPDGPIRLRLYVPKDAVIYRDLLPTAVRKYSNK